MRDINVEIVGIEEADALDEIQIIYIPNETQVLQGGQRYRIRLKLKEATAITSDTTTFANVPFTYTNREGI